MVCIDNIESAYCVICSCVLLRIVVVTQVKVASLSVLLVHFTLVDSIKHACNH
jgi:hypothetical protein